MLHSPDDVTSLLERYGALEQWPDIHFALQQQLAEHVPAAA